MAHHNGAVSLLMPYVIGVVLSVAVATAMRYIGFDRDRAFYPTVLMVVGSYYVLFAAMGGSTQTLLLELLPMTAFVTAAIAGFKSSTWIVAAGLAGHGIFDAFHGYILNNPGMPVWWPAFCGAYDIGAAVCLGWLLYRDGANSSPARTPVSTARRSTGLPVS